MKEVFGRNYSKRKEEKECGVISGIIMDMTYPTILKQTAKNVIVKMAGKYS